MKTQIKRELAMWKKRRLPSFSHDFDCLFAVSLSIDLGHGQIAVAQDERSDFDTELLTQFGPRSVTKLIGAPAMLFVPCLGLLLCQLFRRWKGLLACVSDCLAIGHRGVLKAQLVDLASSSARS